MFLKSDWVANSTFLGVLFLQDFYVEFYFSRYLTMFIYVYYGNGVAIFGKETFVNKGSVADYSRWHVFLQLVLQCRDLKGFFWGGENLLNNKSAGVTFAENRVD